MGMIRAEENEECFKTEIGHVGSRLRVGLIAVNHTLLLYLVQSGTPTEKDVSIQQNYFPSMPPLLVPSPRTIGRARSIRL
jgi:hypothetical protein